VKILSSFTRGTRESSTYINPTPYWRI